MTAYEDEASKSRRGEIREDITTTLNTSQNETGQDSTKAGGRKRGESQRGRVRKQSKGNIGLG